MDLLTRVRGALARRQAREQRMFGGIAFMVSDRMVASVSKRGLLIRVGKEGQAAALADPRARRLEMRPGRPMSGYVRIAADDLSDAELKRWLDVGLACVRALAEPAVSPRSRQATAATKKAPRRKA
jgi:TfoX/Sxy family transcriptional regulator of competence genes